MILTMMFAVVGNINFMLFLDDYKDLFHSFLIVLDAQLGNYDFKTYQNIA